MNIKQRIGVVGGLAALLGSGCVDEKKDFAQEIKCSVNGLQVRVIYHQVPWDQDYSDLELYDKEGRPVINTGRPLPSQYIGFEHFSPLVRCDDGRLLKYSIENSRFYLEEAEKK